MQQNSSIFFFTSIIPLLTFVIFSSFLKYSWNSRTYLQFGDHFLLILDFLFASLFFGPFQLLPPIICMASQFSIDNFHSLGSFSPWQSKYFGIPSINSISGFQSALPENSDISLHLVLLHVLDIFHITLKFQLCLLATLSIKPIQLSIIFINFLQLCCNLFSSSDLVFFNRSFSIDLYPLLFNIGVASPFAMST